MGYDKFMDLIRDKWRMIAILIVVSLIVICVVGIFVLPAEITSSSGAITYNNSTGITEIVK